MEDEDMEYTDGKWKKNSTDWDGAVHSIRNMGDVAFIILRKREGLFQTVLENKIPDCSVHQLKEAMTVQVKGILKKEERAPHGRELRITAEKI